MTQAQAHIVKNALLAIAVLLTAGHCFSADITTLDGTTYKGATVIGIEGRRYSFLTPILSTGFDAEREVAPEHYGR